MKRYSLSLLVSVNDDPIFRKLFLNEKNLEDQISHITLRAHKP